MFRTELIAPEASGFIADSDAPLRHQVFDVTKTQIESMIKPHGSLDYFGWKSVPLIHC